MNAAKGTLIKDTIIVVIAFIIGMIFSMSGESNIFFGIFGGLVLCGIPFGWRWLSQVIAAVSFSGIVLKLIGSCVLGWIAFPVILIKDIIAYVHEKNNAANITVETTDI